MFPYIELFGNKLGTFPLCAGIAILAIVLTARRQLKCLSTTLDFENQVMIAIPLSMASGALVGYLSDVIFRGGWGGLAKPWGFGFTFYGWLIGCMVFYWIYAKFIHMKPLLFFNLFLPSFSLAQACGRIGCFCGGCCYGMPTKCWGVTFPPGSLPYQRYGAVPLIPVQLLETAYLLLVFVILFVIIPFEKRAAWYLIIMPVGRFALEFLRGDNRGNIAGVNWLSPAQLLSIVFCGIGIALAKMSVSRAPSFGARPR